MPVLTEGGEIEDGVRALSVLVENARLTRAALAGIDDVVITVGGDCGVDLVPIAEASARYGDQLTVLWIDAHPDVNTPQTLPSGSFHGMVLGTLLGDGAPPLRPARPLAPEQVIYGGVRAYEPGEREYLEDRGIRQYGVDDLERVLEDLAGPLYVHLDLDVLEPTAFGSTSYPEPGGVQPQRLIELVSRLNNVVGAAITEYAPVEGADDAGEAEVIRQLGAALCR